METLSAYAGAIAAVWIVIGIIVAARFYPGYSHRQQFCSELGALGSPTQQLSPAINNFPLSVWFTLFGSYLITHSGGDLWLSVIGGMIVAHGVGTWIAGYFPMDLDPYTDSPSRACQIHSWAGLVMMLSLLVAPAVAAAIDYYPVWFRLFSVACLVGTVIFTVTLAKAFQAKANPGLHQRLSYGFQILWLFVYSLMIARTL